MSHFLLGLFPTDQEILRQVLTACARMSAKTVQGQNTVDQITGPSLCFNTKKAHVLEPIFRGLSTRKPASNNFDDEQSDMFYSAG